MKGHTEERNENGFEPSASSISEATTSQKTLQTLALRPPGSEGMKDLHQAISRSESVRQFNLYQEMANSASDATLTSHATIAATRNNPIVQRMRRVGKKTAPSNAANATANDSSDSDSKSSPNEHDKKMKEEGEKKEEEEEEVKNEGMDDDDLFTEQPWELEKRKAKERKELEEKQGIIESAKAQAVAKERIEAEEREKKMALFAEERQKFENSSSWNYLSMEKNGDCLLANVGYGSERGYTAHIHFGFSNSPTKFTVQSNTKYYNPGAHDAYKHKDKLRLKQNPQIIDILKYPTGLIEFLKKNVPVHPPDQPTLEDFFK